VTKRNSLRIAVALGAAACLAYTLFRAPAAHVETATPIAADAKAFSLGTLPFSACELPQKRSGARTQAYCAPFAVPENRDANRAAPNDRKIDLRLALIKSEAAAADRKTPLNIALLVAVLLVPAVLGSSQTIFNDGDVSWHIATGQWIIDHRAIPHTDPFSFTWYGRPWVPIEWLAEMIYASA